MKQKSPPLKTFSGFSDCQDSLEFNAFLQYIARHEVKSYLEIGTGRGDTFHAVMSSLPSGSKGITVDLPQAAWGLNQSKLHLDRAHADLRQKGYIVEAIYGDSTSSEIYKQVMDHGPFDLVFIDGDHTYEGVKNDFLLYGGMGKIVALHDIANDMKPNLPGEVIEVPIYWKGLKMNSSLKTIEFITPGSNMGIGVVEKC